MRLVPAPATPALFGVDATSAQLYWNAQPGGVTVETLAGHSATYDDAFGVAVVEGLAPGKDHAIVVRSGSGERVLNAHTLPALEGPPLYRFATMNDLHIGAQGFGATKRIRDPQMGSEAWLHCAQRGLETALAWGAQAIVLKGDIVHRAEEPEWEALEELVASADVPVYLLRGNHEAYAERPKATERWFPQLAEGSTAPVQVVDVPSLRLVLADTTVAGTHTGSVAAIADELLGAVDTPTPVMVLHHHHLGELPFPTHYPKGIHGRDVTRLLREVRKANPNVMFASGHTHRHRRRTRHGVTLAELGSPGDHPGTWCGYSVHSNGISQSAWRIDDPAAAQWSHRASRALLGAWAYWAPGRLEDRCFNVQWR